MNLLLVNCNLLITEKYVIDESLREQYQTTWLDGMSQYSLK